MSHDKIRAAARERMARTGESYAAARRAVLAEYGAAMRPRPHRAVLMSAEIHNWLAGLRDSDPAAVRGVARALAVLLSGGAPLAEPLVASTAASWPAALCAGLDRSYQERLHRLELVRRGVSEAADLFNDIGEHADELESALAALQDGQRRLPDAGKIAEADRTASVLAEVQPMVAQLRELRTKVARTGLKLGEEMRRLQTSNTAFGARKEILKASYATAELGLALDGRSGEAASGEAGGVEAGGVEARLLRDAIADMQRELDQGPWPDGLLELGPAGSADSEVRLLFAFEPAGTVLLIAVLDGPGAVRDRRLEAILLAADQLREVRAGHAPDATERGYDSVQGFLEAFYPGPSSSSPSSSSPL
ncbi:MAG TPA: hypothetical protein VGM12_27160 [Trebonia sp.]